MTLGVLGALAGLLLASVLVADGVAYEFEQLVYWGAMLCMIGGFACMVAAGALT